MFAQPEFPRENLAHAFARTERQPLQGILAQAAIWRVLPWRAAERAEELMTGPT